VGLAWRTCLVSLFWGILVTCQNQRSWDITIRKGGSTFRALRISLHRSHVVARCHQVRSHGVTFGSSAPQNLFVTPDVLVYRKKIKQFISPLPPNFIIWLRAYLSRCELFAKTPSLLLALEAVLFQSLPKIHDHR